MTGLENQWAWSQVEAMADGSLTADDERRMRSEMARDARLRAAVERASTLPLTLRKLSKQRVPSTVLIELMRIPHKAPRDGRSRTAPWVATTVAGLLTVVVLILVIGPDTQRPAQRASAVQEFEVAMTYLQRTAELTRREVAAAVGVGLQDALNAGREAVQKDDSEQENGGEGNGD